METKRCDWTKKTVSKLYYYYNNRRDLTLNLIKKMRRKVNTKSHKIVVAMICSIKEEQRINVTKETKGLNVGFSRKTYRSSPQQREIFERLYGSFAHENVMRISNGQYPFAVP